jgi:hypothetical protein
MREAGFWIRLRMGSQMSPGLLNGDDDLAAHEHADLLALEFLFDEPQHPDDEAIWPVAVGRVRLELGRWWSTSGPRSRADAGRT